jgi:Tol biopolymer transport system component
MRNRLHPDAGRLSGLLGFLGLLLVLGMPIASWAQAGLGCRPPTTEEQAWMAANLRPTYGVRLNALGLQRVNATRQRAGLATVTAAPVAIGDEVITTPSAALTAAQNVGLPAAVDNSTLDAFPPIRSQGSLGSCASFATSYYTMTHMVALARGLDAKGGTDALRYSPKWTYNMINGGADDGAWITTAFAVLLKHGSATWSDFPYDTNFRQWCVDPAVWRAALSARMNVSGTVTNLDTNAGLANLKTLLADGYLLNYATDVFSWQYGVIKDDPSTSEDAAWIGKRACVWVNGNSGPHAMTVVGYNDNLWIDINNNSVLDAGEKGALRIANSWGTGWEDGGLCWVAYDALKSVSAVTGGPSANRQAAWWSSAAYWITARANYTPRMLGQFTVSHAKRNQMILSLGLSDPSGTTPTSWWNPAALSLQGGADAFNGTNTAIPGSFVFDFTDIAPSDGLARRWYVGLRDSTAGDAGTISAFKLIDVLHGNTEVTATNVPQTADNSQVHAYVNYTFLSDDPRPDLQVRALGGSYVGNDLYNADATGQQAYKVVSPGGSTTFEVKVQNDWRNADGVTLTLTGGGAGWTVRAYNALTGGTEITAALTGTGWTLPSLAGLGASDFRITVQADAGLTTGATLPLTISVVSTAMPERVDAVKAITMVNLRSQADLLLRPAGATPFLGEDTYENDYTLATQQLSQTVAVGVPVTVELTVGNDGDTAESFTVKAMPGDTGWALTAFNAWTNGTDIAAALTGAGWTTPTLTPGASCALRVTVTPLTAASALLPKEFITRVGKSGSQGTALDAFQTQDAAKLLVTRQGTSHPDLLIRSLGETADAGDDIYNDASGQTKAQEVSEDSPAIYLLTLQNDGDYIEALRLTTPASAANWTLKAFDAATGGTEITAAVTGAGWTSAMLPAGGAVTVRVEITPGVGVARHAILELPVTVTSTRDTTVSDTAITRTTRGGAAHTMRVSVDSAAVEGNQTSGLSAISADGRYAAFESTATNLVANDTNGVQDIFVHDRQSRATTRVSVGAAGAQANEASVTPAISGDGRLIVFASRATNLVPGDTNGTQDIFLHDRQTGLTTRISAAPGGAQSNEESSQPTISRDGRYVAFASLATTLVANDTNDQADIFVYDRQLTRMNRVSVSSTGLAANGPSFEPSLSDDGRYVAFTSQANNLTAGDTNGRYDIFLHDRATGVTSRATQGLANTAANDHSFAPRLCGEGTAVAFCSRATNLVAGDTNGREDIFVFIRGTGAITRVSVTDTGAEALEASGVYGLAISGDGQLIAYQSAAADLVPGDLNGKDDIFLFDRRTGEVARVTLAESGAQGNEWSRYPAMSADGSFIAFTALANNLVDADTNGTADVFVREQGILFQPDLQLRKESDAVFLGNDLYRLSDEQTLELMVRTGEEARVVLRVQNDAGTPDRLTLTGPAGTDGWSLTYLDPQAADITAAVTGTGWTTDLLPAGAYRDCLISVKTYASLPLGEPMSLLLTATSASATNKTDQVRARITLQPHRTIRASIGDKGLQSNGQSRDPVMSGIGAFVAFESVATNFVTPDANGTNWDVFVHNRYTGVTTLESLSSTGAQANNDARDPDISGDGRYLVFKSNATNLVPGVTGQQIYLRDRQTSVTTVLSLASDNTTPANATCESAVISADGRFVAFTTTASNLLPGVTPTAAQVFLRDRVANTLTLCSVGPGDVLANQACASAAIGVTGAQAFVTFRTNATNLVAPATTASRQHVYLRDVTAGRTELISQSAGGVEGNGNSSAITRAPVSDNGRYVAFVSQASNLVADDTNNHQDVFVRDRTQGITRCVSRPPTNEQSSFDSDNPAITSNGRFVAFDTAGNLLTTDTNGKKDVYVFDLVTNSLERVSLSYQDAQSAGDCFDPMMSADGRYVAFQSTSSDLVQGDSGQEDIFVRDRWALQPDLSIHTLTDPTVFGDGVYNLTGDNQTASTEVLAGGTATYLVRLENDRDQSDHYTLLGTASDDAWTIRYFVGASDITDAVIAGTWESALLAAGQGLDVRITVSPNALLLSGVSKLVRLTASSTMSSSVQDRVHAESTTAAARKTDLQLRTQDDFAFTGDNLYGAGVQQSRTQTAFPSRVSRYVLKVENDGGGTDRFLVTGDRGTPSWTVAYVTVDGQDITNDCTGIGWQTPPLPVGGSMEIHLLITPGAALTPTDAALTTVVRATSTFDPTQADQVRAVTSVGVSRQPDLLVGAWQDALPTVGENLFDLTGAQALLQAVISGGTVSYRLVVQNDGNVADQYRFTCESAQGWTLRTTEPGGALITLNGWTTPVIPAHESLVLRVDLTAGITLAPNTFKAFLVTATALQNAAQQDTVSLQARISKYQPDLLIANSAEPFIGEDLYNRLPEQSCAQQVHTGAPAIYHLQVQNDGNLPDTLILTGTASSNGWMIRYFDALTAGNSITTAVTSASGWTLALGAGEIRLLRVEVTPTVDPLPRPVMDVILQVRSATVSNATDAVLASTTGHLSTTRRISVSSTGLEGTGDSRSPSVSVDGHYTAFCSDAANLVAGDTNSVADIFLANRETGEVRRVSLAPGGIQPNDWSDLPGLSGDGRLLVFRSAASNLVAGDTNGCTDIFLLDLTTGALSAISTLPGGTKANGASSDPVISADGNWIAFASTATNLVAGDTNSLTDLFLFNRAQGTLTRIAPATGVQPNGASDSPAISPDGRFVAFRSLASNLVANDTNRQADIFVYDRTTHAIERTSVSTLGVQGNAASGSDCAPAMSGDGRFVAFRSVATNLATGDTNGCADIFLRDRQARTTSRISLTAAGQATLESGARGLAISTSGRLIVFTSSAPLVADDTNGVRDVFAYDHQSSATVRISQRLDGAQGDADSGAAERGVAMSSDGRYIAFDSLARLTANDLNGKRDIYLHDLQAEWSTTFGADLAIRPLTASTFTGVGELAPTPQVSTLATMVATPARFLVRLQNISAFYDRFVLHAIPAPAGWTARYVLDGADITGAMLGSGWQTSPIGPAAVQEITLELTPTLAASFTTPGAVEVTATSLSNAAGLDTVRAQATKAPLTAVQLTAALASPQPANSPITLTGVPNGGNLPEYRFRIAIKSGTAWAWGAFTAYSTSPSYAWTPTAAGAYLLAIYAREKGSVPTVYKTMLFTVTTPLLTNLTVTPSLPSAQPAGTTIRLTAASVGGENVQYKFRIGYKVGTAWVWNDVQAYGPQAWYDWRPLEARTYSIIVYARSAASTRSYDLYKSLGYTVR